MPFKLFGNDDKELGITSRREGDIELPNRSGRRDPRIKASTPDVLAGLRKAGEGLKKARELGRVK